MNATAGDGKAQDTKAAGNTAVPNAAHGDHDRVQMLSLKPDGTPDQLAPEMIGDEDATRAATREQFTQQAVSAADQVRAAEKAAGESLDTEQDPEIKAAQDEHEKVAKAAEKAADKTVDALLTDK